jgi:TrmH family RNA methyltransferase
VISSELACCSAARSAVKLQAEKALSFRAKRLDEPDCMLKDADHLCVVLVGTRNPLNLGAAARAMSNFGFLRLRVVNPYAIAFREARSAVGATPLLAAAQEYPSLANAVADCTLVVGTTAVRHRELHHPLRRLESGARLIRKELTNGQVALVFGSEKTGLSNQDLSHCSWLIHIATHQQQLSMNLGQAVAVCLYELVRDHRALVASANNPAAATRATGSEIERISGALLEALHFSGYVNPIAASSTEERVRRMVRRLNLSSRDADLWLGMLRQILWKMRSANPEKN